MKIIGRTIQYSSLIKNIQYDLFKINFFPKEKIITFSGADIAVPGYYLSIIKNLDTAYEMQKPIRRDDPPMAVKTLL